ncbi:MAG: hypothetical protein QOG43_3535, partial [Actinomycetota bacterium]|nr:hypothetical protein [Actinomycetota bacterium]MEA2829096.1 hypothetical protein [Actinomycetota bacterium]
MPLVVEELRVVDGVRALVTAVDGLC